MKIINEKYKDQLIILSLNYRDKASEINEFLAKKNNWNVGHSNEEINKLFFVEWFPFGVLIDSKGNIISLSVSLKKLILILEK